MSSMGIQRKKLIEVALPLEAINEEASKRKRKSPAGYPTTLHKWWAQRPLAACRAVLFASIIDDPSSQPEKFPTEEAQEGERQRLFRIIEELVKWENSTNETVLGAARAEIMKAANGNPPPVLDPFCGGGSIPLEAQRLGLEAHGSDLNPVAVLLTKALIEIPPKFAGRPPVNPEARRKLDHSGGWNGAQGLAEDIRYYGKWMRDEAVLRIGHLYPRAKLPNGKDTAVIAWLWTRTVKCPNPACGAMMPLVRSFALSTNKGKEAWIEPVIDTQEKNISFEVKTVKGSVPEPTVNRRGARCLVCATNVPFEHVRSEGRDGRISTQLMAIVVESERGRGYLAPDREHELIASQAEPKSVPETDLPEQALGFRVQAYGMTKHRNLFTPRQLVLLSTLSDLVGEARKKVLNDARIAGMADGAILDGGGADGDAYANAIAVYLAFANSRAADYNSAIATWRAKDNAMRASFSSQAIAMVWDFAEGNPFASSSAGFLECCNIVARSVEILPANPEGDVFQRDARSSVENLNNSVFCTDPPYYDNIGYADLSDFFYIWLRRSLNSTYPDLFSTLLVPKSQELVATPHRFNGNREEAKKFFEQGFESAFKKMREVQNPDFPLTVFYAFKQSEDEGDTDSNDAVVASTGWETLLEGLMRAGFAITGTWPMRTEGDNQQVGVGTNALASSIVLVCRPRSENAPLATRREFLNALKRELPDALKKLQHGNIAPVDLAQAAIGPGMAVFSRYSKVVESDGSPMRVRTALQIINQTLDEVLAEQESEYDAETRWAVAWFEQFGMSEGAYGTAETLSKAKNTSVSGMDEAGVTTSRAGKVRLLRRDELPDDWDPTTDRRITTWEVTQHLIRALDTGGEQAAAALLAQVGGMGDVARDLAYRLYTTSERKGWTQEALAYNSLVVAWPEIARLAAERASGSVASQQEMLGF